MSKIIYRRITDSNGSLIKHENRTHFEAGFCLANQGVILLIGRVVDSAESEIFRSGNVFDYLPHVKGLPDLVTKYLEWSFSQMLQDVIHSVESEDITEEPAYFGGPMLEVSFEVQGPMIIQDAFKVKLSMSQSFEVLDQYQWHDSSYISLAMLCKRETLLQFLHDLHNDLAQLLAAH
jgi:hypothetical protein